MIKWFLICMIVLGGLFLVTGVLPVMSQTSLFVVMGHVVTLATVFLLGLFCVAVKTIA